MVGGMSDEQKTPDGKPWDYLALRVASVTAFCAYLWYGWSRLPNPPASILLGPLWLVYEAPGFASLATAGLLWIALVSPALKPCVLTGCISAVAFPLWLFAGMVGEGAEC
jgi:hypothetical protein